MALWTISNHLKTYTPREIERKYQTWAIFLKGTTFSKAHFWVSPVWLQCTSAEVKGPSTPESTLANYFNGTVDASEIRRSPVDMVYIPTIYRVL